MPELPTPKNSDAPTMLGGIHECSGWRAQRRVARHRCGSGSKALMALSTRPDDCNAGLVVFLDRAVHEGHASFTLPASLS